MGLICPKTANSADKSSFLKPNRSLALIYLRCVVDTDYSDIFNPFLGIKYPIRGSSGGLSGLKMGLIRPKTANSADKSSFAKPNWYRALFYPRCGVDKYYSDIFHSFLGIQYPIRGTSGGLSGLKMGLFAQDKSSFVRPNLSPNIFQLKKGCKP